jgi:hypothetical protein
MENLLFFLATSFVLRITSPRKFKNVFINPSGCCVLFHPDAETFDSVVTESGDLLYFNDFTEKKVTYGAICIELRQPYDLDTATALLRNYIDKLRPSFRIACHTGLHPDDDWNTTDSRTMVDFWQDSNGLDWKVKGYTNGSVMAILYVKNIGQAQTGLQDQFLDSFHFGAA